MSIGYRACSLVLQIPASSLYNAMFTLVTAKAFITLGKFLRLSWVSAVWVLKLTQAFQMPNWTDPEVTAGRSSFDSIRVWFVVSGDTEDLYSKQVIVAAAALLLRCLIMVHSQRYFASHLSLHQPSRGSYRAVWLTDLGVLFFETKRGFTQGFLNSSLCPWLLMEKPVSPLKTNLLLLYELLRMGIVS